MQYTLITRHGNEKTFYAPDGGGYVRDEWDNQLGSHGGFDGQMLWASDHDELRRHSADWMARMDRPPAAKRTPYVHTPSPYGGFHYLD